MSPSLSAPASTQLAAPGDKLAKQRDLGRSAAARVCRHSRVASLLCASMDPAIPAQGRTKSLGHCYRCDSTSKRRMRTCCVHTTTLHMLLHACHTAMHTLRRPWSEQQRIAHVENRVCSSPVTSTSGALPSSGVLTHARPGGHIYVGHPGRYAGHHEC